MAEAVELRQRNQNRSVDAGSEAGGRKERRGHLLLRRGVLGDLVRDRTAIAGMIIVVLVTSAAIAAPLLTPHDPLAISGGRLDPPSLIHPLGTDALGRDIFSRLLFGARLSLGSAFLATTLVMTIAVIVGTVSGFYGGLLDMILMRIVDSILAFPGLILAIAIAGLFKPGILPVMIGLVSVWWVAYSRIIRSMVLALRERPFIEGARAMGASDLRIMRRHIIPHIISPIIVLMSLEMGSLILAISGLNFLGLGAQPPTPEWGAMLNEGRVYFMSAPRMILIPGFAIGAVVLGFNLIGDGIRDVIDPRIQI